MTQPTKQPTTPRDTAGRPHDEPNAADQIRSTVREGYAAIAKAGTWNLHKEQAQSEAQDEAQAQNETQSGCCSGAAATKGGGCCGPSTFSPDQLAQAIGYANDELDAVPEGANMGLSCGNPAAIAALKPGEIVLDLGSGGGFDCFIAGAKVGPTGQAIGVDMTPEMLTKARANTVSYRERTGMDNVEFRLGEIEHLPVADNSVDVVISNCVLNLSPDKPQVWREILRVLGPGGRVAISDIALLKPLPDSVRQDLEALVGCVAGAASIDEVRQMAADAGLSDITLHPKSSYINAMSDWKDPLYKMIVEKLPQGTTPGDYLTSLEVTGSKPCCNCGCKGK